jgi:hypothetical protein
VIFLEFVRAVDQGKAKVEFSEPIKWGEEWCTADFIKDADDIVRDRCRGLEDDPLADAAAEDIMSGVLSRLETLARTAGAVN